MFDAKRLLDQFLSASGPSLPVPPPQPDQGSNVPQAGTSGDLAGALGALTGLGGSKTGGLGQVLGGSLGGVGGGAMAGGLAALLMGSKKGRKLAGSAVKLGGMALVGALAYRAYSDWQSGKTVMPSTIAGTAGTISQPPAESPFSPDRDTEQQALGRQLLRAMIAAAKADGHIDATEQAAIFAEMDKLPLDVDDKAFVMDELRRPLDVDAVAGAARNPEEAAAIYTASLLAIDVDNASERAYLGLLAARMNLDEALVRNLHAAVEGVTQTPALPR